MTEPFANLVSGLFAYVIDLQARIGRREDPPLEAERAQVLALLGEAEARSGASSQLAYDFELAKYALVYWIDEVLINSPWAHAAEWRQQILEWDLYQERLRADRFYEKAHEAEALGSTDPLEVYYLCVALGFRGKLAESRKELMAWSERAYNRIVAGSRQPDRFLPDESEPREPLRPLPGKATLLAVSVLVSLSALFTLACFVVAIPPW